MKHNQRGSIVVFALIILAFVLTAAMSVAAVVLINRRSANISVNSSVAFQNSDKGMEDFLQQLHKELASDATLTDVAAQLSAYTGEAYRCEDGDSRVAATIGTVNNRFIITAYEETPLAQQVGQSGWGTIDIGTDTERISEREELRPFQSCASTMLRDIDRFKVVGNQNNAMRAVFVKIGSRGDAGLVAHWDFEDWWTEYLQHSHADGGAHASANTQVYTAQDIVGNSLMEFCRRNARDVEVSDRISGQYHVLKTSSVCPQGSGDNYILPKFYELELPNPRGMLTAFGFVREFHSRDDSTRPSIAVQFGTIPEMQNYLVARVRDDCRSCYYRDDSSTSDCVLNCIPSGDDRLLMKDGITVSAWVKWEGQSANHGDIQPIVSRWEDGKGYRLYLKTTAHTAQACFQINRTESCGGRVMMTGTSDSAQIWHHVVGRWEKGGSVEVIVDDTLSSGNLVDSNIAYARSGNDQNNIYIGADTELGGTKFYKGIIDDVKIWNRKISNKEVNGVCQKAQCRGGFCQGSISDLNLRDATGFRIMRGPVNSVRCFN